MKEGNYIEIHSLERSQDFIVYKTRYSYIFKCYFQSNMIHNSLIGGLISDLILFPIGRKIAIKKIFKNDLNNSLYFFKIPINNNSIFSINKKGLITSLIINFKDINQIKVEGKMKGNDNYIIKCIKNGSSIEFQGRKSDFNRIKSFFNK